MSELPRRNYWSTLATEYVSPSTSNVMNGMNRHSVVGQLLRRHASLADESPIPAKRVGIVAIKLRHLIEETVCVEIEVPK